MLVGDAYSFFDSSNSGKIQQLRRTLISAELALMDYIEVSCLFRGLRQYHKYGFGKVAVVSRPDGTAQMRHFELSDDSNPDERSTH